ncbi:TRAP transporter substrate-binding protein DctP [Deltaproteobacteria bacterium]|nr:TRAP transporter substrate-binding protein DctP [Deltaproteobacteria bacterium]
MGPKKSVTQLSAILLVVMVLIFGTCIGTNPGAYAAEEIRLKFAFPFPKNDMYIGPEYMIQELEKRTNGRVKITPYFNQSLGNMMDSLEMLQSGIADIVLFPPTAFSKVFQIFEAPSLPSLNVPNLAMSHEIVYTLLERGLLKKDLAGLKPLIFEGIDPMYLYFTKKVTSLDELRKMKLRAGPGVSTAVVEALGCSVVNIPSPDVYMAIDRGVADGLAIMPDAYFSSRLNEVAKHHLDLPFGTGAIITVMTQKTWDSLPADIQIIWEKINWEAKYYYLEEVTRRHPNRYEEYKNAGAETYSLSPEESKKWLKLTETITDTWVKDKKAQGYPAEEALDLIRLTVESFQKK